MRGTAGTGLAPVYGAVCSGAFASGGVAADSSEDADSLEVAVDSREGAVASCESAVDSSEAGNDSSGAAVDPFGLDAGMSRDFADSCEDAGPYKGAASALFEDVAAGGDSSEA